MTQLALAPGCGGDGRSLALPLREEGQRAAGTDPATEKPLTHTPLAKACLACPPPPGQQVPGSGRGANISRTIVQTLLGSRDGNQGGTGQCQSESAPMASCRCALAPPGPSACRPPHPGRNLRPESCPEPKGVPSPEGGHQGGAAGALLWAVPLLASGRAPCQPVRATLSQQVPQGESLEAEAPPTASWDLVHTCLAVSRDGLAQASTVGEDTLPPASRGPGNQERHSLGPGLPVVSLPPPKVSMGHMFAVELKNRTEKI